MHSIEKIKTIGDAYIVVIALDAIQSRAQTLRPYRLYN
ncbi:hypothetical protein [Dolichospermum flos-aquae]